MSKNNGVIDKLMNNPRIKNLGLKQESIVYILKAFNDLSIESLLENGYLDVGNGMLIEIVQLSDRVHVLRGIPYKSSRKFKLKLTMDNTVYDKIDEYYSRLRDDIT